jgi:hypothetical protein
MIFPESEAACPSFANLSASHVHADQAVHADSNAIPLIATMPADPLLVLLKPPFLLNQGVPSPHWLETSGSMDSTNLDPPKS